MGNCELSSSEDKGSEKYVSENTYLKAVSAPRGTIRNDTYQRKDRTLEGELDIQNPYQTLHGKVLPDSGTHPAPVPQHAGGQSKEEAGKAAQQPPVTSPPEAQVETANAGQSQGPVAVDTGKVGQVATNDGTGAKRPAAVRDGASPKQALKEPSSKRDVFEKLNIGPEMFVSLREGNIKTYYTVGKTLGEGSFGKVCIVTQKATGIVRAMKAIKKSQALKDKEVALFNEVAILRQLDHPNIIKLFELFQDEKNYYLIMEYCQGGELFDRLRKQRACTESIAALYMKQIFSALLYINDRKFIHRDLKPENMLLDTQKFDSPLKIIDFGTAAAFKPGVKMNHLAGTPYYISPEMLNGAYDEKCDVWSCGIILYVLLCGYPPFTGPSNKAIFEKIRRGAFEFNRVSVDAKQFIKKLLVVDPSKRLSAKEALSDSWITKYAVPNPNDKPSTSDNYLGNLSRYHASGKLKQALMTFIASQVTSQVEKSDLQRIFQSLDKDGNGTLNKEELIEGYKRVFPLRDEAEEEAKKILDQVDANNSGKIDFTEFVVAAMQREKLLSKTKIEQAFKMLDLNGDGFIDKGELNGMMGGGMQVDKQTWIEIIGEYDENQDGKISLPEFINLLEKKGH